jgi:hypothetical protein
VQQQERSDGRCQYSKEALLKYKRFLCPKGKAHPALSIKTGGMCHEMNEKLSILDNVKDITKKIIKADRKKIDGLQRLSEDIDKIADQRARRGREDVTPDNPKLRSRSGF